MHQELKAGEQVSDVVRFVPKSELERARLIREARAIYDSIFPPNDVPGGQSSGANGRQSERGSPA